METLGWIEKKIFLSGSHYCKLFVFEWTNIHRLMFLKFTIPGSRYAGEARNKASEDDAEL